LCSEIQSYNKGSTSLLQEESTGEEESQEVSEKRTCSVREEEEGAGSIAKPFVFQQSTSSRKSQQVTVKDFSSKGFESIAS
jgi:hypothetical protein